jgi:hypothetical protein
MRLTTRSPKNNCAYLVKVKSDEQAVDSEYPNTLRCIIECFEKLAKYEETGLEPEQIEALRQENKRLEAAIQEWADGVCISQKYLSQIGKLQQENAELKERQEIEIAAVKHSTDVIRELGRRLEPLQGKAVLMLGDMPESCIDCGLWSTTGSNYNTGEKYCKILADKCPKTGRHPLCPLWIVGGENR